MKDSVLALQVFNLLRFSAFFLVSILLVKIPLQIEEIADYEYVLFLSSIVTGWWINGFLQGFMVDSGTAPKRGPEEIFRTYSHLFVLYGGLIMLLVVGGIEILAHSGLLTPPPQGFFAYLLFHFILLAATLMAYYFHRRNRPKYIYLLGIYFFLLYLGSFTLLWKEDMRLPDVYATLAILAVPILIGWIILYIRSRQSSQSALVTRFPHLSILMLVQGIGFISLWSDGFWVQYFYGTEKIFALFRYGGREFPLFLILTTTFATALIPESGSRAGLARLRNGSLRYIKWFFPLAILLIVMSRPLFTLVYSADFRPASLIFDLYILLVIFRVLFLRTILIGHRRFKILLGISLIELLVNIAVSYILYWPWGLLGLIAGSFIAHLIEMILALKLIWKNLNLPPGAFIPVREYLLFVAGIILVLVIKYTFFGAPWIML